MRIAVAAALLATFTVPIQAGKKHEILPSKIPANSKIFIAKMDNGLDGFIPPEIIKQKLPIVIVLDEAQADYVLVGASIKEDDHWYNYAFWGKDRNEGNVRMLNIKEKTLVWAGEAGDRSLWWGMLKRGGQRKVADRIIRQMKKDLGL